MSNIKVEALTTLDEAVTVQVAEIATVDNVVSPADVSSVVVPNKILKTGSTSGIPTLTLPSTNGQRLFINKAVTTNDDLTVLQVNRDVNVSGGTSGFVGSAIAATSTVNASGAGNYEWTGLFIMNSNVDSSDIVGGAASPQNVAIYGQAKKNGTAATWAGCLEIQDNAAGVATNGTIGLEVTAVSRGSDLATPQRLGVHVAIKTPSDNTIGAEWGAGFNVTTEGTGVRARHGYRAAGSFGSAVFYAQASTDQSNGALMVDASTLVRGIDLSGATYSSSQAIRLALGQQIAFDNTGANYINASGSGLFFSSKINANASIGFTGASTSTTATAGSRTLPTNPDGFLNITVDGNVKKIPYYL